MGTTTTDKDGRYSFEHLPDGTYSVKVVKDGELADTEQTEDPDANKDNASEPVTLGEDNPSKDNIDFGYVPDYSIHGLVYRDGDRDETHGATEKGYANQTVELRDKDGKVVATTTTDENGAYSFSKLPAGDYTVTVVKDGALTDSTRPRTRTPPRTPPLASSRSATITVPARTSTSDTSPTTPSTAASTATVTATDARATPKDATPA